MTPAVGRPSLDSQIAALAKRLLAGPIKLDETSDVEDRVLARMESLDLVDLGATTARLTEKGKALAGAAPARNVTKAWSPAPCVEDIEFVEPPRARCRSEQSRFVPIVEKLKTRPGKWARIQTLETPALASTRAGAFRGWRKKNAVKDIEICSRTEPGGGGAVYARFIGKGK